MLFRVTITFCWKSVLSFPPKYQPILNVSLSHIEFIANEIADKDPEFIVIQGEILTNWYLDGLAEEINEMLQEAVCFFWREKGENRKMEAKKKKSGKSWTNTLWILNLGATFNRDISNEIYFTNGILAGIFFFFEYKV